MTAQTSAGEVSSLLVMDTESLGSKDRRRSRNGDLCKHPQIHCRTWYMAIQCM